MKAIEFFRMNDLNMTILQTTKREYKPRTMVKIENQIDEAVYNMMYNRTTYDIALWSKLHSRVLIVRDYCPPYSPTFDHKQFREDFCSFYQDYYQTYQELKSLGDKNAVLRLQDEWHKYTYGKEYALFMGDDADDILYVDLEG